MNKTVSNIDKYLSSDKLFHILDFAPAGILIFNSDWKIEFVNQNFLSFASHYDFESDFATGNILNRENLFPDTDLRIELTELTEGIPFESLIKSKSTADKSTISLILKGSPIFDEEEFNGGILIIEDLRIPKGLKKDEEISSGQIEKIINKVNDFLFITDSSGKIKFAYGKKLNKISDERFSLFEKNILDLFTEYKDQLKTSINFVREKRLSDKIEFTLNFNDEQFIYECKVEPLINRQGQIQFIFFWFTNITDLVKDYKKLEAEIEELTSYQIIAEASSDAIFAIDLDGKIKFWNKASETLFGFKKAEVYDKFFGRILGLFEEDFFAELKETIKKNKFWKREITVFKDDEEKVIIETKFALAGENEDLITVHCNNITERALAEKKLRASEEKFSSIVKHTDQLICSTDVNGKITYVNPALIKKLKYSRDELVNRYIRDFIEPSYLKGNTFDLLELEKSNRGNFEFPFITKDSSILYFLINISHVHYESQTSNGYNIFFNDITETKTTEKNLELFKSLFEASQDGIAVEKEGKIIIANDEFAETFGYKKEEIKEKEIYDLVSERDIIRVTEKFQQIKEKREASSRFEFLGQRKNSSNFYAEVSVALFTVSNNNYDVIVARDITEMKRTQQAIHQSEEKFRNLTDNIDDFLYTFEKSNGNLRPVFYTTSVEKITGYTQTDLLSDTKLILKMIHPDDFPIVKKKIKNMFRSRITLSDEFECRIINRHGNIVWVRNKVNLTRNNEGQIQKIYGLVSDVSLRKKAENELQKTADNLIKLNETKDRFISIISHDLRTPFSSILGFTDILLTEDDIEINERKQYVKFIQESSNSMLSLVNSLLDWTRLQTGRIKFEPERISAYAVVDDSINALSGTAFQKDISLNNEVERYVSIFADQHLINQVFNNLISNAIKFTNKGGTVTIKSAPSKKLRFHEFSVEDTGVGIKPENVDKLFKVDTKFTSEGTAGEKGSGLGLSLVKEIIERHGGSINVTSELGTGTKFTFLLPIGSPNILLVDDSKTDRLLYSKILKNITPDYNIDIASDGKEAFDKIRKAAPALVITDHFMPEMNGYELVQLIFNSDLKHKPPIIILSSDIDRQAIHEYNELGIQDVFAKPVNLSIFKSTVEKALKQGVTRK